jgi:hypothetical protein
MSIAEESLRFSGLFEAELLVELMLRQWQHPHASDQVFRNALLERGVEILHLAIDGTSLIDGLQAEKMNLVAAVWCAEVLSLDGVQDDPPAIIEQRRNWTHTLRRAVPSCFCDPKLLD